MLNKPSMEEIMVILQREIDAAKDRYRETWNDMNHADRSYLNGVVTGMERAMEIMGGK